VKFRPARRSFLAQLRQRRIYDGCRHSQAMPI
jgi:hypothetical protein